MPKKQTKLLLLLASVGLVYALVEFLVFPLLLPRLPQALFAAFPRAVSLPGQSSKGGLLPRPGYLALAGDSCAQGQDGRLVSQGGDPMARTHTAHLLHEALGRDVVGFGRSGAGSVEGLVLEPLQNLRALRRLGLAVPDPGCLLLFFSEADDRAGNRRFLDQRFLPQHPHDSLRRPGVFRGVLDGLVAEQASGRPERPGDTLLFANLVFGSLRDQVWRRLTRNFCDPDPAPPSGTVNAAMVGGRERSLPDRLQGPPLDAPDLDDCLFVFEQSALYIRDALKGTRCVLVYVPAPLSCYALSGQVQTRDEPERRFTPEQVAAASDAVAARLRDFARASGLDFIDTRPGLRAAAAKALIHGPRAWDQFNKTGCEAFARAVGQALPAGACGPGASS